MDPMEPTPIQRPTMGPEACPTCGQKNHPGGTCPGKPDPSDTRAAESARDMHTHGPTDAEMLAAARVEIERLKAKENEARTLAVQKADDLLEAHATIADLQSENARLLTEAASLKDQVQTLRLNASHFRDENEKLVEQAKKFRATLDAEKVEARRQVNEVLDDLKACRQVIRNLWSEMRLARAEDALAAAKREMGSGP